MSRRQHHDPKTRKGIVSLYFIVILKTEHSDFGTKRFSLHSVSCIHCNLVNAAFDESQFVRIVHNLKYLSLLNETLNKPIAKQQTQLSDSGQHAARGKKGRTGEIYPSTI